MMTVTRNGSVPSIPPAREKEDWFQALMTQLFVCACTGNIGHALLGIAAAVCITTFDLNPTLMEPAHLYGALIGIWAGTYVKYNGYIGS